MIAFKKNRPILQVGAGFISEYNSEWLSRALDLAAERAGIEIPLKNDLIASILYYLEQSCDLSVLPVDELFEKIKNMLRTVGLSPLANHLANTPPPYPVNVAEIAKKNPLPLFFLNELKHEVAELNNLGLTNYDFKDLRPCVLALQGHKKWSKSSDNMLAYLEFILEQYNHSTAA